jgi:hypothetical protein
MRKNRRVYGVEDTKHTQESPENTTPGVPGEATVAAQDDQNFVPITAEEQAIAARTAADSNREWETIGEESALDYSLGRDKFELPEPAKKAQNEKRFAFRWIARTPARIDQIRSAAIPERWWLCNSTNTPFLQKFLDPVLGCVTREDQILVFKPWWMHEKMKALVSDVGRDRVGKELTHMDGTTKGDSGATFSAVKRTLGQGSPSRTEVKGGDVLVYDDNAGGADLSDIVDNE